VSTCTLLLAINRRSQGETRNKGFLTKPLYDAQCFILLQIFFYFWPLKLYHTLCTLRAHLIKRGISNLKKA